MERNEKFTIYLGKAASGSNCDMVRDAAALYANGKSVCHISNENYPFVALKQYASALSKPGENESGKRISFVNADSGATAKNLLELAAGYDVVVIENLREISGFPFNLASAMRNLSSATKDGTVLLVGCPSSKGDAESGLKDALVQYTDAIIREKDGENQ